jgi:PKD repeat protein
MRKLYSLLTGLLLSLVTLKTTGQTDPGLHPIFSDLITVKNVISVADNNLSAEDINAANEEFPETCQANFEESPVSTSVLSRLFTAIPWHSEQKKPVYICWKFGDGKDTCIQYSNTNPGPYTVLHHYQQPGTYEVCVRIVYQGGCDARKCKPTTVGVTCKADFEKLNLTPSNNPLEVTLKALPWHNQNKKPKQICWIFGDGRDTCIQYPENYTGSYLVRHKYREAGQYNICVKILYYGGCEANKCKVTQVGYPVSCKADFEKLQLITTNNPLATSFKALPWHSNNKKPKQICWRFGDGKDTCITYPENYTGSYTIKHEYREPGLYEVCVKIIYYGGCEAYKCKTLQIGRPDECKADFERVHIENPDNPLVVGFKALPWHNNNKKPKVICWSFGDGQDTCVEYTQNFSGPYVIRHKYKQPGTYNVCIKILYYGGCEARKCKTITATRPDECRVDFEKLAINTSGSPLQVYFKALPWHNNNKKPKQICWKFGDGKDTCIQYPENYTGTYGVRHQYREPGVYNVCVKIIYYGGCEAYKCKEVIVGNFCKADFERLPLTTVNNPLSAIFKALPWNSNNKKPKTICWRFGDGKDTCVQYPENYTGNYTVRHDYRQSGTYEVCVKITYYGGCEAYKCKPIQIGHPTECKADFERLPVTTANPLHVAFKAIPWHINNKKPKTICWKFGDGKDTCIQYPENYTGSYTVHHRYDRPGNYEVCVKILYYGGCEAKKCELVKVEGQGECKVKLYELTPSITSLVRGFYAAPWSSDNKKPVLICWYFGDGKDTCIQLNSAFPLPQLFIRHTYPGPGVYKACVKIVFEGGCIAYDCDEVVIRPTTNICGGYMTDSLTSPRTFKFKGYAIHNPDDPVAGYRWTFGDGSAATGREVTHQYNAPGTYEICLTIKTQRGCETKICKKLIVPGNTAPLLHLTPNPVVNVLHVLFYSTHNEPVNIRIVNANGVIVRNYIRNATTGANNWDLDLSTLTGGSYMLYVQSPNQLSSQLFVKAN